MPPKTWEEIETFDDIILEEDREIISELEKATKDIPVCPHIKKVGEYFYYCSLEVPKTIDEKPSLDNPVYTKHVGTAELQLFCFSVYKVCITYQKKQK